MTMATSLKIARAAACAAALFAAGITSTASAAFTTEVYSESFAYAEGSAAPGWNVLAGGAWHVDSQERLNFPGYSDNALRTSVIAYDGLLDNGGDPFDLTDYRVTASIARSTLATAGLIGRLSDSDNFYHARWSGSNTLQLYKWVDGQATSLGSVSTTSFRGIMELIFDSSTIILNHWDENNPTNLLATLEVQDTAHASGTFGARAIASTGEAFAMSHVAAYIPEPASLALMGMGGLLLLRRKR